MKLNTAFSGRVLQVLDALSFGDAVSTHVQAIHTLAQRLGLHSEVYTKWHDERLELRPLPLENLHATDADIIILHFYGYSEYAAPACVESYATRIILYHNITPARFFPPTSPLFAFCAKGRTQLEEILPSFHYCWAVSKYNLAELFELGAKQKSAFVIPLILSRPADNQPQSRADGNWLFVGRIAQNKNQLGLVRLFSAIRNIAPNAAKRLALVGGYDEHDSYVTQIREEIARLKLQDDVQLLGKVTTETLLTHYRNAGLFVSLSEHEGFGAPLIEAALHGIPVLALASSGIVETMGGELGLAGSLEVLRNKILSLGSSPSFRTELLKQQSINARRFHPDVVLGELKSALSAALPVRGHFRSVSVVICTYNRLSYLKRVLRYLAYQTVSSFEVIVVDGPSTDGTKAYLETMAGTVKVLHNPAPNLSISRNLGIEASQGQIVAFIDDDAIPFDDWIETILAEYNKRPLTTSALGGPVYYAGTLRFQVTDIGFNNRAETIVDIDSERIGKDGYCRSLLGTNSTFLRDALIAVDGFDEQYDYFLDETDLCWRLHKSNHLIAFSKELLLRHEFAESANRRGRYNYNWQSICKNLSYFVFAYSGLEHAEAARYLTSRLQRERVTPIAEAAAAGELDPDFARRYTAAIWSGFAQGESDSTRAPRTRNIVPSNQNFLPFPAIASGLRLGTEIRRLHICILSKEFPPFAATGGIGTLYYHLASELLLMGHFVTVIVPTADPTSTFEQGRFRVVYATKHLTAVQGLDGGFQNNLSWSASILLALTSLQSVHPVDIVDCALWDVEALCLSLLAPEQRPPLLLRLVTPFPLVAKTNNWSVPEDVYRFFCEAERLLISRADAVVPISNAIQQSICSTYEMLPDYRWQKIACGVTSWPQFDVSTDYGANALQSEVAADLKDAKRFLLFIGRLERRKGIDVLLAALPRILAYDNDLHFVFAGRDVDGWRETAMESAFAGHRSRVHFLGEISDAAREYLMSRAYALLFPSRYESFGLVPLEAFVHGLPVIASAAGAIPEVVQDEECGLLFSSGDVDSLCEATIRLLADKQLRDKLSVGAHKRAHQLDSRNMAQATLALYAEMLSKNS